MLSNSYTRIAAELVQGAAQGGFTVVNFALRLVVVIVLKVIYIGEYGNLTKLKANDVTTDVVGAVENIG